MTTFDRLLPHPHATTIEDITAAIAQARQLPLPPGDKATIQFCARLSALLLQDQRARPFPELAALGFWLREASLRRMIDDHLTDITAVTPAGTVFHLPPGNVPTLFAYGAALSLLCGNTTVIRLSGKDHAAQSVLVDLIGAALAGAPETLRHKLILLRYGHDDALTTALSLCCDLRIVWGGDATVAHIAALPRAETAEEILFGDRFSAAALDTDAYLQADDKKRAELVRSFSNDIYWFDQFACASPRLLVWIGAAEGTQQASTDFYRRLARHAEERKYRPAPGAELAKLNMAYLALHDLPAISYQVFSPALTVIDLPDLAALPAFKQTAYGFGLLLTARLDRLEALAAATETRDQTLTVWGFPQEVLNSFAAAPGRRGFDRVVPTGQALAFDPVWDGHNLFAAMTRRPDNR